MFHFLNTYFLAFLVEKTLNGHNSEPVTAFDLISMLRARPKYQLSVCGGLHAAKYMGLHAAKSMGLHTAKSWLGSLRKPPNWDFGPKFEKTTMTTSKSRYIS